MSYCTRFLLLLAVSSSLLLLIGCQREESVTKATPAGEITSPAHSVASSPRNDQPVKLLIEALPLQRSELPAEALASWRDHAASRPTLLILSGNPMLAPVPPTLRNEVQQLLAQGSRADFSRRGSMNVPDPILTPIMTVDAALRADWFSQVVWVVPLRDSTKQLPVEAYRQVLGENGMLDPQEMATLQFDKYLLRGSVRGKPFLVGALDQLPSLEGPLIVYVDQSYFQELYKNEVATPLLTIVYDTIYQLREQRLSVLAVNFNYGNLDGRISLDVRFLAEVMSHFVEHPERAQQPPPRNWQRMADIFHLGTLFETEKSRDLALTMERDDPESAWVQFALYRAAAARKAGDYALRYLAEAVKRDRIYAVEYLNLAQMAYDKRRPDASLQMLQLAATAFPDNPHIQLQMAKLAGEMGDRATARKLVAQLQKLPWSSVYFPDVAAYLGGFDEYLQTPAPASAVESGPAARAKGIFPSRHLMGRPPRQP